MSRPLKPKFGLDGVYRKNSLIVSLLCLLLFLSLFTGVFAGHVKGQSTIHVDTEQKLRDAIRDAAVGVSVDITLDKDIGLTVSMLSIPANKDITLRSNGNAQFELIGVTNLNTITIEARGVLTLAGITVTHVNGAGGVGVVINSGGKLTMSSGKISGNVARGVTNSGNFTMSGGIISNSGEYGVYTTGAGSNFTMTGGEISNNRYGAYSSNIFNMTNGKISGNTGNGVYVAAGTFAMSGGEVSNNVRGVDNRGTFIMSGGKISGNTVVGNGAGVYNTNIFTMTGGEISGNTLTNSYDGGGVWNSGTFTMYGGEIANNAARNGGGVYRSSGYVNLYGGRVSGNTASNDGGGVWVVITNLDAVSVRNGVVFSGNRAYAAYNRDPIHNSVYNAYIGNNVVWTSPLTQGYNNFDISYVYGTSITTFHVTVHGSYATPSGAGNQPVRSTVTLNAGTRNGYTFSRWTVNEGGMALSNLVIATPTFTMPANNVVVTASWNTVQYSISYTLNGGTASGNPTSYNADGTFAINNPTRTGYNFLGWTVRYANGTELIGQFGYNIPSGSYGNVVFTANWGQANQYAIAYVLNGGINAVGNPTSYSVADLPRSIGNPTRAGYSFQGWTAKYSDGRADMTYPSTYYSIPSGVTGLVTLTANWTPIQYSITYTLNGGTATGNPTWYNADTATVINNPTRTGYNFIGWTVRYANDTQFTGQVDYCIPLCSYGNVAFTANWGSANQYVITYVLNGGTNAANNPLSYSVADLPRSIGVPTHAGYNFLGWTVKYSDGRADITTPTVTYSIPSGVTGLVILTANWNIVQYSITYTLNGGTVTGNPTTYNIDSTVVIENPTRAGYNFLGWTVTYANNTQYINQIGYTIPRGSYGNVVLTANWGSANEYSIAYVLNGGENAANNPASYTITALPRPITNPTRAGYNFQGWTVKYSDGRADITTPTLSYTIPSGVTGPITLTANWTPIQYTVTYALNGGTNTANNPTAYNVESTFPIAISNPTLTNYDFSGWTVRYANGTEATGQSSYRILAGTTGNIILTANWRSSSTGGGSGSDGSGGNSDGGSSDSSSGSSGQSGSSGSSSSNQQSNRNNDYYDPTGQNFTVQFVDWDGTLLKSEIVTYGGYATPPDDPSVEDFIFNGWDGSYQYVTGDTRVTALYRPITVWDDPTVLLDSLLICLGAVVSVWFAIWAYVWELLLGLLGV